MRLKLTITWGHHRRHRCEQPLVWIMHYTIALFGLTFLLYFKLMHNNRLFGSFFDIFRSPALLLSRSQHYLLNKLGSCIREKFGSCRIIWSDVLEFWCFLSTIQSTELWKRIENKIVNIFFPVKLTFVSLAFFLAAADSFFSSCPFFHTRLIRINNWTFNITLIHQKYNLFLLNLY